MIEQFRHQLFAEPDATRWDWFTFAVGTVAFIYGLTTTFVISPPRPEFLVMGLTLIALSAAELLPTNRIQVASVLRALGVFGFVLFPITLLLW